MEKQQSEQPVTFAGFWIRLGAYCIDSLVLLWPSHFLSWLLYRWNTTSHVLEQSESFDFYLMDLLFQVAFGWMYFAICHSSAWQASVGKRVLSLKVVDYAGQRISFFTASIRSFSTFLSGGVFLLGYLMIDWTEKKQALHDMIAKTYVIKEKTSTSKPLGTED